MSMPTAEEIINRYLFNQPTLPSEPLLDKYIRPSDAKGDVVPVNADEYMKYGAGRYADISSFKFIREFLGGEFDHRLAKGERVTIKEYLARHGHDYAEFKIGVSQYIYGVGESDFADRCYVFGSTAFTLSGDTEFWVDENGVRHVSNAAIIPDPEGDNFDFTGGSWPADISNYLTKDVIDPSGIGRKVPIIFEGEVTRKFELSSSDASTLYAKYAATTALEYAANYVEAIAKFRSLMISFQEKGIIGQKDAAGRYVFYDGSAPNADGNLSATKLLSDLNKKIILAPGVDSIPENSSVALIGGGGNDILIDGLGNDVLVGNDGNDILTSQDGDDFLYGGAGSDTYGFTGDFGNDWINDSDGSGQITVDGQALSAQNAKKVSANTYKDKATGWTFFKGDVQTDGTATLVISKEGARNSSITVRNWRSAQLGITLNENMDVEAPSGLKTLFGDQFINQSDVFNASFDSPIRGSSPPSYTAYKILALNETDALGGWMSSDWLDGGEGDDLITGGAGQDTLLGGLGNDAIFSSYVQLTAQRDTAVFQIDPGYVAVMYGKNNWLIQKKEGSATWHTNWILQDNLAIDRNGDLIDGGMGNDTILGSNFSDTIDGAGNDDTIAGWGGSDMISGGDGADFISGDTRNQVGFSFWSFDDTPEDGNDAIDGGNGNDTIYGEGGKDTLFGGANDDKLFGDRNRIDTPLSAQDSDYLAGGEGADQLVGGGKNDILYGSNGNDSLWGDDTADWVPLSSNGNDHLYGEAGEDQLIGGGYEDTLYGGSENDRLWGDDTQANLAISAHGKDYLDGGEGNDQLIGGGNDDQLLGGEGNDLIWGDDSELSVASAAHGRDYLSGGNGLDKLYGGGKDDVLFGGNDNDSLWGDDVTANLGLAAHGNDELYGGAGNDQLIGGGKDDQLHGGTGSDILSGDDHVLNVAGNAHGTDFLDGGADNDYLYGDGGNDTLMGGSGNDFLAGEHQLSAAITAQSSSLLGDDLLMGEEGTDVLLGGEGNDTLDGGADNDTLIGGAGADTYLFDIGSGQDTIDNEDSDTVGTNKDTIVLGAGITPEGVTIARAADDLIISLNDSEDRLYVQGYFQADGTSTNSVENIKFNDGHAWDIAFVKAKVLIPRSGDNSLSGYDTADAISGLSGADNLSGNAGNDTLEGGRGNDTLYGGAGSDTYQFSRGDGQDTIGSSTSTSVGDIDALWMKSGFSPADVILNTTGTSLIIKIKGSTDHITVEDFLYQNNPNNSKSPLQQIKFADGPTWNLSTIVSNLYGGSDLADRLDGTLSGEVINGQGGNDTLNGNEGNDTLNGGTDSDTLDGGVGNDTLRGGTGADTYLFGVGSGQDLINNEDSDALGVNRDAIQLGAGLTPTNVTLTRSSDDLIIRINGSDDQLTVQSYFQADGTSSFTVENLRFDGDTVWSYATVKANVGLIVNGTAATEAIAGGAGNDALFGQAGSDTLDGGAGNDALDGGLGNDSLRGGAGDDTYRFGKGDGQDIIASNAESTLQNDTLSFKPGVALSDVRLSKSGTSLLVKIANSTDQVTIEDFFYQDTPTNLKNAVKQLEFTNGIKWSLANITTQIAAAILQGNASGNQLTATSGNHIIYGGQARDTLWGGGGDDSIYGEEGSEIIDAGYGNDYLDGGPEFDWLRGGAGDDTLDGGTGNDGLDGGVGNNTYLFGRGDGMDRIEYGFFNSADLVNTLLFKPGVSPSEIILSANGDRLIINIAGAVFDQITVEYFFFGGDPRNRLNPIQQIKFANGTTWNLDAILGKLPSSTVGADAIYGSNQADVFHGLGGADSLYGNGGDDTLEGGTGNDTINGGEGSDTYVFGKGDGQDVIRSATDAAIGKIDTLLFNANVSAADISLSKSDTSLIIKISGTTDQLTIDDFFSQSSSTNIINPLQRIQLADGAKWSVEDISALVATTQWVGDASPNNRSGTSGNDKLLGLNGNDTLSALVGSDFLFAGEGDDSLEGGEGNDWLYGEAGNDELQGNADDDHLIGGIGNDQLHGGLGNDTYLFRKGDGKDVIHDQDTATGNSDVISFADVKSSDLISVSRSSSDGLVFQYGTSDYVEVKGFFLPISVGANQIASIYFSDGVNWTLAEILQKTAYRGTLGNDNMTGYTDGGNQIDGGDGEDTITGAGYVDTLSGGLGRDILIGGAGDDWLSGGAGTDTLEGGLGTDSLYGDAGTDTYIYNKGDGLDIIYGQRSEDTLRLTGIKSTEVFFSRQSDDIRIALGSPGANSDIVALIHQAFDGTDEFSGVSQIVFDDTTINAEEIRKRTLQGTSSNDTNLRGYATNDTIAGMDGQDALYGEAGNDVLDGGTGADTLVGGAGNDVYYVDNVNDLVIETTPAEYDRIGTSVNYVLPDFVEDMDLAAGAASAIKATGNALDNVLGGNEFNNVLSGGAGDDYLVGDVGTDTMIGGAGNDYFYIDNIGDVVQEDASNGYDTVLMFFIQADSYTLSDNVEAIEVFDMAPVSAGYVTLRGNALDNSLTAGDSVGMALYGEAGDDGLYGGSGNDTLYGGTGADVLWGGSGQDSMLGGGGDDLYYVSDTGDRITEYANEGIDTVTLFGLKANSYIMATQVENLDIFEVLPSSGLSFTIFGNAQDNVIDGSGSASRVQLSGGAGNDHLFGTTLNDLLSGAAGNDTLYGGLGSDSYSFGRNGGQDVIDDADATTGNLDQLTFGTGVANDQLWFSQSGQDLVVSIIGSTDQVTIRQWSAGAAHHVERITAGGKSLADTQVANLVQAMSAMTPPPIGQTTLSDAQRAQLAPVLAANWA